MTDPRILECAKALYKRLWPCDEWDEDIESQHEIFAEHARAVLLKWLEQAPTSPMISAMNRSRARDDEGPFPPLMDIMDFSGENKAHTVLKAAYTAMCDQARKELS